MIRSIASVLFLTLLLGCSRNPTSRVNGDNGDLATKAPPAGDVVAQEKELADLDRQIAVREKELAELKSRADALREKIAAAKGSGAAGVTSLEELLGKLPKDSWPKGEDDSLKWAQASEWYSKNVVGKRATWTCRPEKVEFFPAGSGKFNAVLSGAGVSMKIGEANYFGRIATLDAGRFSVSVTGLSTEAAEKLRAVPKEKAIELVFTLGAVSPPSQTFRSPSVQLQDVTIKGIGP